MMHISIGDNSRNRKFLQRLQRDKLYSVEFMVEGLPYLFQFKIWNTQSKQMFIIVKESSDILNRIKEGESFNMKYISSVLELSHSNKNQNRISHKRRIRSV